MVFSPSWITALSWQRGYGFSSSHVWMWELDHKEGWALKNWCFRTVVLKMLESLLDCKSLGPSLDSKEIKPVNTKGNQPWIFTGRADDEAEAEAPIPWPDMKSWITEKDSYAGKDRKQKGKRVAEDEMVGWHHRFNGDELGQTPGDGERQGSLVCCSPWDLKELDTTWRLNNNYKQQ